MTVPSDVMSYFKCSQFVRHYPSVRSHLSHPPSRFCPPNDRYARTSESCCANFSLPCQTLYKCCLT